MVMKKHFTPWLFLTQCFHQDNFSVNDLFILQIGAYIKLGNSWGADGQMFHIIFDRLWVHIYTKAQQAKFINFIMRSNETLKSKLI